MNGLKAIAAGSLGLLPLILTLQIRTVRSSSVILLNLFLDLINISLQFRLFIHYCLILLKELLVFLLHLVIVVHIRALFQGVVLTRGGHDVRRPRLVDIITAN
jgi:hypothetical protein